MKLLVSAVLSTMMAVMANAEDTTPQDITDLRFNPGFFDLLPTDYYVEDYGLTVTCPLEPNDTCTIKGPSGEIHDTKTVVYEFNCPTYVHQLMIYTQAAGLSFDLEIMFGDGSTESFTYFKTRAGAWTNGDGFIDIKKFEVKKLTITKQSDDDLMYNCNFYFVIPPETCDPTGGGGGDPHFYRWHAGERETFQGECDLVMAHSDSFHNNAGFDLHVRTTIKSFYSYIESAAVRIGEEILEISSEKLFLNGEQVEAPVTFEDPLTFYSADGHYTYTFRLIESEDEGVKREYLLDANHRPLVKVRMLKHFMALTVLGAAEHFDDSQGLLGRHSDGAMIDRSGAEFNKSFEEYAMEWQVNPMRGDPSLFMDADRAPQLPREGCRMPTENRPSRRLLRSHDKGLYEKAAAACSAATSNGHDLDLCVDDIMATGELGLAGAW